jgi:hypothetical protein
MTARMVGVCEACQQNKHGACSNKEACVCAMREHPEIKGIQNATPKFRVPETPQR